MISQLGSSIQTRIFYPEDNGQSISDNTKQFRRIMEIYYNLEWLFADVQKYLLLAIYFGIQ